MDTRQRTVLVYPVVYPNDVTPRCALWPAAECHAVTISMGGAWTTPVPTYIYTGCYTDWVWTVVTTDSCPLCQSNGSLTCPFAGGVTAGVHKEGLDMFIPLRWMTKMTRMTRNLKSRPWEWLAEVYGNLVIVVIVVMEGVSRAALCPSTMHHRHALYDSRRVTGRL